MEIVADDDENKQGVYGGKNSLRASSKSSKNDLEEWWQNEQKKITPLDASYSAHTFIQAGYECYYCGFKVDSKSDYERHVIMKHGHSCAYPSKAEIEKMGLKAQGKEWEI
jgi:hypothetical protein